MVSTATKLKRPIWTAAMSVVSGVQTFATPVARTLNYRSLNSNADIRAFGPDFVNYLRIEAPNADLADINPFDRVWIRTAPANPADQLATDSDYYVISVDIGAGGVGVALLRKLNTDA